MLQPKVDADDAATGNLHGRPEVDGGKLSWKPTEGRANHRWDAALLAIHGRHFAPRTSGRRPFRLVKV